MSTSRRSPLIDAALLVMVVIWGVNYSVIKAAIAYIPPRPFAAARLSIASVVFLAMLAWAWATRLRLPGRTGAGAASEGAPGEGPGLLARVLGISPLSRAEWGRMVLIAVVGQLAYHLVFMDGMAHTTAANTALLIGASPIAVSLATALAGHERLSREHWTGLALSFLGVYLVVGEGAALDAEGVRGDLMLLVAVTCWAAYTVLSRPLLDHHSPLVVTAWPMAIGAALFVLVSVREIAAADWRAVPAWAWWAVIASAVGSFNLSYLIYYVAVQRLGAGRTSIFSNLVPLVGVLSAAVLLHERVGAWQLVGAALILGGVVFTRIAARHAGRTEEAPAGE